ncbi:MAG: hypothetical protein H7Z42_19755 [Roseiflexaceae bacterium]|nr:hypothetical protein [Roseiflexaceae bacterium]
MTNLLHNSEMPTEAPTTPVHRPATTYLALWPIGALLLGEVLAAIVLAPPQAAELAPAALVLACAVLIAGLVPALLRPSVATNLVGCSAVLLASVVWRGPHVLRPLATFAELGPALAAHDVRLSLLNIVLLAPVTLQLAAFFPERGRLATWRIVAYYMLVVGAALTTFMLPMPARQGALVALLVIAYSGFGSAGYQFLRTIQRVQPAYPRAAQQARLILLCLVLAEVPFLLLPWSEIIRWFIPIEVVIGAQIILPIGIAYTIMRRDLFGIDTALRRMLDYAAVSFGLLVIYFGLAGLLTQVGRDLGGIAGLVATVVSVIAAAAAFAPLHRITQHSIDRVFYPERLAFGHAISTARTMLSHVVQRHAVVQLLEDELPQQLGAPWAKLMLRPAFEQPAHAAQPGVWSTLLLVGGQPLGAYWLGPRRSGLKYDANEQEQLLGLIQQAALALAYAHTFDSLVQLNAELEERVATRTEYLLAQQRELAAFEERQRLARDLHDSVKQTLFSLGLGLRAARSRIQTDPAMAALLLQQQEQAALQAQTEMADLLGQLRMPASGGTDLVVMLQQHCTWMQQHGLQVTLKLPASLVLAEPLPRELAQVVKEALQNVLRHSGVTQAQLTLAIDDGTLLLAIIDDGCGFDPSASAHGYGLRGMHERVAALGGKLVVRTAPGKGTTLWLQIDLAEQALHHLQPYGL